MDNNKRKKKKDKEKASVGCKRILVFTRKEGVTHVHNIQGNILVRHG